MSLSYPTLPTTSLNTGTPNTPALYTNQLVVGGVDFNQAFSVASSSYDMTFNGNVTIATGKTLTVPVTNNNITAPNLVYYDTTAKKLNYTTTMPSGSGVSLSANNNFTGVNTITLDTASKNAITAGTANASTAIGQYSSANSQGSISIGYGAAQLGAGLASISIGQASAQSVCPNNCITISALGGALNPVAGQANSLYIAPIRNNNVTPPNLLCWDSTTKEVYYTTTMPSPTGATLSANNAFTGTNTFSQITTFDLIKYSGLYKRVIISSNTPANNAFGLYASGTLYILTGGNTTTNLPLPQTGYELIINNLMGVTLTLTGGFGTLTTGSYTLATGHTVTMIFESTTYGWVITNDI